MKEMITMMKMTSKNMLFFTKYIVKETYIFYFNKTELLTFLNEGKQLSRNPETIQFFSLL